MATQGSARLSIVLPTYNRNRELEEAVESILRQTYSDIELIVVDDGSKIPVSEAVSDVSFDAIERVEIIRHAENSGANVARNTGIRAATGEYIAFLDDDDRWQPEKAERVIDTFDSVDPEVGVVYTGKRVEGIGNASVKRPTKHGNVMKDLLTGENFGQFSSVAVRSDVLGDAGLPDERFPAWQDREWFFRLAQHCHFEPIPDPLTIRQIDHENRIGYDYETQRDVAYPLFVEKHYSLAREHGRYYARAFLASLRFALGKTALLTGRYSEARKQFLLAFASNPLYLDNHPYLLATLAGRWSYKPTRILKRAVLR